MIEVWRAIVGYPSYEVSNLGRVRSLKWGNLKILKPVRKSNRRTPHNVYICVNLTDPTGKAKKKRVHRLVMEAFVGSAPSDKHHVGHIDGNSTNNWLENLKWVTQKENEADKLIHGTRPFGTTVHNAKLNPKAVRRIRRIKISDFAAIHKTATALGVNPQTVRDVINGITWNHIK